MTDSSAKSATEIPSETRDLKAQQRRASRRLQIRSYAIEASGILVSVHLPAVTSGAIARREVFADTYAYDYLTPENARLLAHQLTVAARVAAKEQARRDALAEEM